MHSPTSVGRGWCLPSAAWPFPQQIKLCFTEASRHELSSDIMEGPKNHSQPTSNKASGGSRPYTTASYGDTTPHEQMVSAYSEPRSFNHHMSQSDSSPPHARNTTPQAASTRGDGYTNLHSTRATTLLSDIALATQLSSPTRDSPGPGIETTRTTRHPRLMSEGSQSASYTNITDNTPNIIIFGETGVGKSSLLNMISGTESAMVSGAALGCTFQAVPHEIELSDRKYRLWDTAGLNEGEKGNVSADRAIQSLQELVHDLRDGGVSLLVYCIRGSRIRDIVKINYDLFHTIICSGQVPIVVVITGLENEENMEDWWIDNAEDFHHRSMWFAGYACITATKGKVTKNGEHMFKEEYNQSVKLVRELIIAHCPEKSWKPDGSRWLGNIAEKMRQMYDQSDHRGRDHARSVNSPVHPMSSGHQFVPRCTEPRPDGPRSIIQQLIDFLFFVPPRRR
ncbi:hypothetical protein APHAL10511_008025 [Amanita phalloides]|nr:hypothetical protein APHAL10511_008025 [Amanita phalloides]